MGKVANDVAIKDAEKWFDYVGFTESEQEKQKDQVKIFVEAIENGFIEISKDKTVKQKLKFPIENSEGKVTKGELIFKPRLKMSEIHAITAGIKGDNIDRRLAAYIQASAGIPYGILAEFSPKDYGLCQVVAGFLA